MSIRYFIKLCYKGTHFHGWQVQPKSPTIQSCLNHDLSIILGEPIQTTGAGRTDTGVHARNFYAHFDSRQEDLDRDEKLIYRLNGKLPKDICARSIVRVISDAHARYSALSRTYEYHIVRMKDPFLHEYAHALYGAIDTDSIAEATETLFDYSDFTSFSRTDSDVKTFTCKIIQADWKVSDETMVFTITADRFLRNMVRAIVGTLIDVGFGKISTDDFREIIESKNRSSAGASAPAKGLFLTGVEYPEEIFL